MPKRMARFLNMESRRRTSRTCARSSRARTALRCRQATGSRNPAYAATLRRIASQGPRALLESPLRDKIIARTHGEPRAGTLAAADFDAYQPRVARIRSADRTSSTSSACRRRPPPACRSCRCSRSSTARTSRRAARGSAGLVPVRDGEPADVRGPGQVRRGSGVHSGAGRRGLLDAAYIVRRAALIGADAGTGACCRRSRVDRTRRRCNTSKPAGTSHFVVIDREGNMVSMTTTVESLFGSGRAVGRVHAEQPADGFLVPAGRRRRAGRECRGGRQAAAFFDGAGHRARCRAASRRRARLARRLVHPRLQREDDRRPARLEAAVAAGDRPAERDRAR